MTDNTVKNITEQADSELLRQAIQKEKLSCYDYMESILRYDENARKHSGFRTTVKGESRIWTIGESLEHVIKTSKTRIERMIDAHIKKYPD